PKGQCEAFSLRRSTVIVTSSSTPAFPLAPQSMPPLIPWTESILKRFQRSRPPWASIASFASSFIFYGLLLVLFKCRLVGHRQHHAEPCFALHHAGVTISSLFERKCLDHRTDILQDAEGQSVFVIDRRAGQRSVNRAPSKNKRHRTQLDRVLGYTHHDELAAW